MAAQPFIGPLEAGIPVPPPSRPGAELRERLRAMKVGESFVTDLSQMTVHNRARRAGVLIVTRMVEGTGQLRVWRRA